MSPATFRARCEQFLFCYRVRMTPRGVLVKSLRTMSVADAEGVLASPQSSV